MFKFKTVIGRETLIEGIDENNEYDGSGDVQSVVKAKYS